MLPASRPPPTSPMISSSSTLWATASKEWVIPPKPKPGRKPKKEAAPPPEDVDNETDSKGRRVQNRAAQRAFRERKQSQLAELQARIQLYEQGEIERNVALQNVAKRLKEENEALRKENVALKEQVAQLESERTASKENDNKRPREDTPMSTDLPANKKAKLAVDTVPLTHHVSRSASAAYMSSPPSMVSSPDSHDTSDSSFSPIQLASPANDYSIHPTQISLESMFDFPSTAKQSGYDAVSSVGHFDCGFCNEHTPCVCREIALNQVSQMPSDPVFKVEDDRMEDFSSLRPDTVSILDNLPAYQPPVPLRRRTTTSPAKPIFPVVKQIALEPSRSNSDKPANCSGDPSNCAACADDVFGKAFCTAIGASVESSAPCSGCPSMKGSATGRGCCGGTGACVGGPCSASTSRVATAAESSLDTIPTNDAWRQLKSHPNVEFADLTLLAEVVAGRSKCTGPRVVLSPPPTQPSDAGPAPVTSSASQDEARRSDSSAILLTDPHAQYRENQQKRTLSSSPPPTLVPHEELVECGRRRGPVREVHTDAVREALRMLDAKFGSS